jgi:hypothetical protein
MTLLLLTRRLHLYLGMFLLPWMAMFGASALLINHPAWWPTPADNWRTIATREYTLDRSDGADPRAIGRRIMLDLGYDPSKGFGVYEPEQADLAVAIPNFRRPLRVTYWASEGRLQVEERQFAWGTMLRDMHTHSALWMRAPGQVAWALAVFAFCLSMLLWIASGLYMWWKLPGSRRMGWVVIVASLVSFAALAVSI